MKDLATKYWGFCDRFGLLYRLDKKDAYTVLAAGNVTQYVKRDEATGTLNADSTFTMIYGSPQGGYFDYGSKGVNGEIVDLNVIPIRNTNSSDLLALSPHYFSEDVAP